MFFLSKTMTPQEEQKLRDGIVWILGVIMSYRFGAMTQDEFFEWCDKVHMDIIKKAYEVQA